MKVFDSSHLNEQFNVLFRAADLEGMVNLYAQDAVLVPSPGTTLVGAKQIEEHFRRLLTLQGELIATQLSCVLYGDMALLHAKWSFNGKNGSGNNVHLGGHSSKVAKKSPDGSWRYVIDVPSAES